VRLASSAAWPGTAKVPVPLGAALGVAALAAGVAIHGWQLAGVEAQAERMASAIAMLIAIDRSYYTVSLRKVAGSGMPPFSSRKRESVGTAQGPARRADGTARPGEADRDETAEIELSAV
jgi:hypothetical protein